MKFAFPIGTLFALSMIRVAPMLSDRTDRAAGENVTLRLDGQITGRWVMLLQRTCEG